MSVENAYREKRGGGGGGCSNTYSWTCQPLNPACAVSYERARVLGSIGKGDIKAIEIPLNSLPYSLHDLVEIQ